MNRQRSHYRSLPEAWWSIEVDIIVVGEVEFSADVIDLSGGGMCVAFDEDAAPAFDLGNPVTIRLKSDEIPNPIDAAAIVVRAEADGGRRTLGLQFIDWMGLAALVPKSMASVFNLRADPRLTMDPSVPTALSIRDFEGTFDLDGVLCDISCSGLSFSTELLSQCVLNRVDYIVVEFKPPALDLLFTFGSCIRYRGLSGEALRYGVWFDPELTERFSMQRTALGTYVDGRLKAALQYVFAP